MLHSIVLAILSRSVSRFIGALCVCYISLYQCLCLSFAFLWSLFEQTSCFSLRCLCLLSFSLCLCPSLYSTTCLSLSHSHFLSLSLTLTHSLSLLSRFLFLPLPTPPLSVFFPPCSFVFPLCSTRVSHSLSLYYLLQHKTQTVYLGQSVQLAETLSLLLRHQLLFHLLTRSQQFDYPYDYNVLQLPGTVLPACLINACDEGTSAFLRRCDDRFHSMLPMMLDSLALLVLRPFFSTTTVNGLSFRGSLPLS